MILARGLGPGLNLIKRAAASPRASIAGVFIAVIFILLGGTRISWNSVHHEHIPYIMAQINAPLTSIFISKPPSTTDSLPQRYILMLDLWERLVNMRTAFMNIATIGKDINAYVIVPFIHESKVGLKHSLPHHFIDQGKQVTSLGEYFSVPKMKGFGNILEYESWALNSGILLQLDQWRIVSVISAIIILDWRKGKDPPPKDINWCEELDDPPKDYQKIIPSNAHGPFHLISPHVVFERKVCIHGESTRNMTASDSHDFWIRLFDFVQQGVTIKHPITLALQNYRKHGWQEYVSSLKTTHPYSDLNKFVVFSDKVMNRATRWKTSRIGESPYIAVHFRAGRKMDLINRINNATYFVAWASSCIRQLKTRISLLDRNTSHGARTHVFLATDLLNNGMKGGEFPQSITMYFGLRKIRAMVMEDFKDAVHIDSRDASSLNPHDVMGAASLLDMAISIQATRFVSMVDSFGMFVAKQREVLGYSSDLVDCIDPPGYEGLLD